MGDKQRFGQHWFVAWCVTPSQRWCHPDSGTNFDQKMIKTDKDLNVNYMSSLYKYDLSQFRGRCHRHSVEVDDEIGGDAWKSAAIQPSLRAWRSCRPSSQCEVRIHGKASRGQASQSDVRGLRVSLSASTHGSGGTGVGITSAMRC